MDTKKIIEDVWAERKRQDEKFGQQNHSAYHWCPILGEELGEVADVLLRMVGDTSGCSIHELIDEYRTECVQVIAVAAHMVECVYIETMKPMVGLRPMVLDDIERRAVVWDREHGKLPHSPFALNALLMQKYGRICKVAVDRHFEYEGFPNIHAYRIETLQFASMVVCAIVEMERRAETQYMLSPRQFKNALTDHIWSL